MIAEKDKVLSKIVSTAIDLIKEDSVRMITRAYILGQKIVNQTNDDSTQKQFEENCHRALEMIENGEDEFSICAEFFTGFKQEDLSYRKIFYLVHPTVASKVVQINRMFEIMSEEDFYTKYQFLNIILEKAKEYIIDPEHLNMIARAYILAEEAHAGQKRKSGEPYIIHPVAVALKLIEERCDAFTICGGLLHDAPEDKKSTHREVSLLVHPIAADLVEGVTRGDKEDKEKFPERIDEYYFSTRKMYEGMNHDIRVVKIKLADRWHNTKTFEHLPAAKRNKKVTENFTNYIHLADLVGNYQTKCELEDISFKWEDEDKYESTQELIEKEYEKRKEALRVIEDEISKNLRAHNITAEIEFRPKTVYSTYQRLLDGRDPLTMHDLFAFIIKVDKDEDCVKVYDILSKMYNHMGKKFKDYRNEPKYNGYRAIHTTARTDTGPVQFQICTHEMHQTNEHGLNPPVDQKGICDMQYVRENLKYYGILDNILETEKSDQECVERITKELLVKKINVYSITGDKVILPEGATILDFLSQLPSQLTTKVGKVIVNDKHVYKLNHKLKNRDNISVTVAESYENPLMPTEDMINEAVTHDGRQYALKHVKAS